MANCWSKDKLIRFNEEKIGIDNENIYVAGFKVKNSNILQADVERIAVKKICIAAILLLAVLGVTALIVSFLPRALQVMLAIVCFTVIVLILFENLAKKGKYALILNISNGNRYMFSSDNSEILEKTAKKIRQALYDSSSIGDAVYVADFSNGTIGERALECLWEY